MLNPVSLYCTNTNSMSFHSAFILLRAWWKEQTNSYWGITNSAFTPVWNLPLRNLLSILTCPNFGLQPIFLKILNLFDHSMLSVATFARITSLTSLFFERWGGGGLVGWGYWKRDTTRDLYFSFPWVSISWSLIVKFNRIWPVMFIMTFMFIIGNLSWTVCSLTGSPIHKAAGIKWSAFKELFTEYWHTGTNSRHSKSNPMSWLVLDIKYRSKDVLQTM